MSQVNIEKTLEIVRDINDYIARKEKDLPYNINVIDELHANENAHSRILCKLLQYKDSFGKYRILEDLIQYISQLEGKEEFANIKISSPEIDQEQERIDLWVRDNVTGYAIIFENKVKGAGDQPNQLARYIDKTLKQGFKKDKIFVIYLPHDEHEPEEYSWILDGKNYKKDFHTRYVNLSFKLHILPWLKEEILPNCIIKEELLISAIKQYIDHLEGLFWMRPSQKKMIMNNELLKQIGLRTDLGFAEQYNDFIKILNQLSEATEMLRSYRQSELDDLMKKFVNFTKDILGVNDWSINDQISTGKGWFQIYNKNWKTKSSVHLEWQFSIDSIFSKARYKMVLHLEGGWNKKNFANHLLEQCSILKQTNSTTFYTHYFESNIPIGQMTDEQLNNFLYGVYKSNDIQEIIKTINTVNEKM
ncbi:MAG: PD-(D/E)XK nuclease family protein [Paludibacteraceae bacterium]|nr:PD-(D/E)XK nuclease family protein [Paludibacteraceae bacterium]